MLMHWWRLISNTSSCNKMSEIGVRLNAVLLKIKQASCERPPDKCHFEPRLVAVSKTKPVEDIIEAYAAGQKTFGENYVNELVEKATSKKLLELCPEIRWHFIGRLQRNKVAKIVRLPALTMVETVESEKLADALNAARLRAQLHPLPVMVQVNTSGEENKGGVELSGATDLVRHIQQQCPALVLTGLMTIGAYNYSVADGPNPDFQRLVECRDKVCCALSIPLTEMELSMGMSSDYEHAIHVGSSNVRVGSEIFGARQQAQSSSGPAAPAPTLGGDATASPRPDSGNTARMSAVQ